jgi:hypothetical protein
MARFDGALDEVAHSPGRCNWVMGNKGLKVCWVVARIRAPDNRVWPVSLALRALSTTSENTLLAKIFAYSMC